MQQHNLISFTFLHFGVNRSSILLLSSCFRVFRWCVFIEPAVLGRRNDVITAQLTADENCQ